MEEAHNLTDRTFIILRKRNFLELTFQEFRSEYATTFNVVKPPERAKLMKLAIIKVSYSARHKKQIMKIFIEKDYICDFGSNCSSDSVCNKLHCLKSSDRCYLFDRDQTCSNFKCNKLHIPIKSLHKRIIEIFKKSNRSCMPFSKFIVLHRTTYPYLREHHPTNDILSTSGFSDMVKIENTEKTKEIRLLRYDNNKKIIKPPTLSENIDAPYPSLKIIHADKKWIDTNNLIYDIKNLFAKYKIKDIFIPGHSRMAFVEFNSTKNAHNAVKKLNNTWFCGRKVTLSLSINNNNYNDEEKVPLSSSRIVIKAINNVISEQRISEWLDRIGSINNISTCFNKCSIGSSIAYIHFQSNKIINEILNKQKKNNYLMSFRKKQIKLQLVDDGYTDSCSYYSIKNKKLANEFKNNNIKRKNRNKTPPPILHSISAPHGHKDKDDKKQNDQNDSMQLLVMRLKSLIFSTIQTQKELQNKLKVVNKITAKNGHNHNNNIDIDIAFGDETYTIDAIKVTLQQLKNDKNQISVYKQALTAFESTQSRSINKNQKELRPICDREIKLAKKLQSTTIEIELLEKQLLLKKNEQNSIKSDLEIVRNKVKTLRKNISDMKYKIEPIKECLNGLNTCSNNNNLPTDKEIKSIENNLKVSEINIKHWLKWKEWNLKDATQWIGNLENGKFKSDLNKFNALNKISTGSILNAITDPTLQIIGIDDKNDRQIIIKNIALLKSRTAMMRKSLKSFNNKRKINNNYQKYDRRKSLSSTNFFKRKNNNNNNGLSHSFDDISVGMDQMLRSNSIQSDGMNDNNLCVICMDREIAPYAMVPCGHQSLCSICKNLIKPNKHKCPMCNGKVTMIIKLFRA